MSYLVLARKWRPKRFSELVGQEHVVRALSNALDSGRVHHAFLFTGTRGVGKTTIARIFAKSLNCERGTGADPCGECSACLDIDGGRYIDLLEIDAASNTGVDDVREVIENAQYMPSRGRYKVYLIDEVHMLSKAAFNALLKTLEEPPGHVKFLLATTDPQKLPVTVLSRCLQFNLKRLDEDQIAGQIARILQAEGIEAEDGAVRQIARAADGSLRDGLSLLDQAIAYTGSAAGGGALRDDAVGAMLGTVDRTRIDALLAALADGDGPRLLEEVAALAEFSPDWSGVLEALSESLHRIQVRQLVPTAAAEDDAAGADLAARLRPEVVQLWYQMALNGRRDLPLAPTPRTGFEMSVLRMLAFRPLEGDEAQAESAPRTAPPAAAPSPRPAPAPATSKPSAPPPPSSPSPSPSSSSPSLSSSLPPSPSTSSTSSASTGPASPASTASAPVSPSPTPVSTASADGAPPANRPPAPTGTIADAEQWLQFVRDCELKGGARQLAEHAAFVGHADGVLRLVLDAGFDYLRSERCVAELSKALAGVLGAPPTLRFATAGETQAVSETLKERTHRERGARQSAAEEAFMNDPDVQRLIQQHGARLVPDSIRPHDE